jgi:protein TonB
MTKTKYFLTILFSAVLAVSAFAADTQERPMPVKTPPPRIEDAALKQIAARVSVVVTVDETGSVTEISISKSSDERFNQPALDAVKQWKFRPATVEGNPVPCKVTIPINFNPS